MFSHAIVGRRDTIPLQGNDVAKKPNPPAATDAQALALLDRYRCPALIEQDHRSIKLGLGPMLRFNRFRHAAITIADVELIHLIRKGHFALSRFRAAGTTAPEIWSAVLAT